MPDNPQNKKRTISETDIHERQSKKTKVENERNQTVDEKGALALSALDIVAVQCKFRTNDRINLYVVNPCKSLETAIINSRTAHLDLKQASVAHFPVPQRLTSLSITDCSIGNKSLVLPKSLRRLEVYDTTRFPDVLHFGAKMYSVRLRSIPSLREIHFDINCQANIDIKLSFLNSIRYIVLPRKVSVFAVMFLPVLETVTGVFDGIDRFVLLPKSIGDFKCPSASNCKMSLEALPEFFNDERLIKFGYKPPSFNLNTQEMFLHGVWPGLKPNHKSIIADFKKKHILEFTTMEWRRLR